MYFLIGGIEFIFDIDQHFSYQLLVILFGDFGILDNFNDIFTFIYLA
jgi:hypothetical protein